MTGRQRLLGLGLPVVLALLAVALILPTDVAAQAQECPCTVFGPTDAPGGDAVADEPLEVGMKVRSSEDGFITAARFYKQVNNTGRHVGHLWSSSGEQLAEVEFIDESASGWQEEPLPVPIAISQDTTYVVSYHSADGRYGHSAGYFSGEVGQGPLRAPAAGNGVYHYGPSGFPDATFNATNYWVDATFERTVPADTRPPRVSVVSPLDGATGVESTTEITATFDEPIDPATITPANFKLRDGGDNEVAAAVTYDDATQTATLIPTADLPYGQTYTATINGATAGVADVSGNPLAADRSWSLTTLPACPCSVFSATDAPLGYAPEDEPVEVGMKLSSSEDGFITAVRFYKPPNSTGRHVGHLWSSSGEQLAEVEFAGETPSGWQEEPLPVPIAITQDTSYVVSYHSADGRYGHSTGYFSSEAGQGPLRAPALGNGVFRNGPSGFPDSTFAATNYWVDATFERTPPPDTRAPRVASATPASGAAGVYPNAAITATFDEPLNALSVNVDTFVLEDDAGNPVAGAVSYDTDGRQATFSPSRPLAHGTTYRATIKGESAGAVDLAGNRVAQDFSWTFSTPAECPCTIFAPTDAPAAAEAAHDEPLEVGVKLRSSEDGVITSLRFYKQANNTGTHVGHLWSADGQLLATAPFLNETSSGWQQAELPSPIPVTKDTIYVASYHSSSGYFAFERGGLSEGRDRPPLRAPAAGLVGGNGVFRYGASAFPDQTYDATNYWVDATFERCRSMWIGSAGDGVWANAANWSPSSVPTAADRACVPSGVAVRVTSDHTVGSVAVDGRLVVESGSLTVSDTDTDSMVADLEVSGGALDGPATINVSESFAWTGGELRGSGRTELAADASGTITLASESTSVTLRQRRLVNHGSLTFTRGQIAGRDGATIHNEGIFELHDGSGLSSGGGAAPSLHNRGVLVKAGGAGIVEIGFDFANQGTVREDSGSFRFTGERLPLPPGPGTPPTVVFTKPNDGAVVAGMVELVVQASDADGIKGVQFRVDGQPIGLGEYQDPPYELHWDSTSVGDGMHRISVIARDHHDATATEEIEVEVANAPVGPPDDVASQYLTDIVDHVYRGSVFVENCGAPCQMLWRAEQQADDGVFEALMEVRVRAGLFGEPRSEDWRRRIAEESPTIPLHYGADAGTGHVALSQEREIQLTYENLPPTQWANGPDIHWESDWDSWWNGVVYHHGPPAGIGDTSNRWVGVYTGGVGCTPLRCDVNELGLRGGSYYWYAQPCRQYPRGTAPPGPGFVVRSLGAHGCTQYTDDAEVSFAEAAVDPRLVSVSREAPSGTFVNDSWPRAWTDPGYTAVRARVAEALRDPSNPLFRWYREKLATPPAQRVRPLLFFDGEEKWRPLNVNEFFAEGTRYPGANHRWCPHVNSTNCAPILDASSLNTYSDGNRFDDRIDIKGEPTDAREQYASPDPNCLTPPLQECDSGPATAIYWHRTDGANALGAYSFYDFWWFYRYNEFENTSIAPDYDHEGDWEGMMLAVPQDDPWTFDYAVIDAHGHHWRYLRDVLYCDGILREGSCGYETASAGMRVHAYVAEGSHATYPRPCDTACAQTVGLPDDDGEDGSLLLYEKRFDGSAPWGANDDPDALIELPPANGWNDRERASWVDWDGRWGMTQDQSFERPGAPESPAHSGRERFWDPMNLGVSDRCNTERWTDPNWLQCDDPPDGGGGDGRGTGASAAATRAEPQDDPCAPWAGPFVEVLICSPDTVERAAEKGNLSAAGTVSIDGEDRRDAVASAPGVTQLLGDPTADPGGLTLEGRLPKGSRVLVRAEHGGRTFESRFDDVELRRGQRLRIAVGKLADGRLAARLNDQLQSSIAPDAVTERTF